MVTSLPDTPSLATLQEHGTLVGPGERYYWYDTTLYIVDALPEDTSHTELIESHGVAPGQRLIDPETHRIYTVRKSRKDQRVCEGCGNIIKYGQWYGGGTNQGSQKCFGCLRSAPDDNGH